MSALSFLGSRIEIECDDAEALAGLQTVYASVPVDPDAERHLRVRLRLTAPDCAALDLPGGSVVGRGRGARGAGAAVAFALFHEVAAEARGALVVHAGALDFGQGAVLLVAPSHTGKSTLSTALALRGAAFLSDEAAPLQRGSGEVRPFLRAVGLRPGPLTECDALAPALAAALLVRERGGAPKYLVDLVASGVARPGRSTTLRHVVFLLPSAEPGPPGGHGRWRIELDAAAPGVAARLRVLPGVRAVEEVGGSEEPALRIAIAPGTRFARALDDAVAAEGRVLIRVAEELPPPDFAAEPRLRRLGPSEGVLRLARFLENGAGSTLFRQEMGSNPGRLVFELAGLAAQARHWELTPGDLERRCRLIEDLP